MKLNLSLKAHAMLKYVLSFTGEKEIDQKGQEVFSPRRLSGEESAQRRHYLKKINAVLDETQEKINEETKDMTEKINKGLEKIKKDNPQHKGEEDSKYDMRIAGILNADVKLIDVNKARNDIIEKYNDEKHEIELTDKTKEVAKKYFDDYGEKIGWASGDDSIVEEIESAL